MEKEGVEDLRSHRDYDGVCSMMYDDNSGCDISERKKYGSVVS